MSGTGDGSQDWAVDSEYSPPRADGKLGPPDDWKLPSWYDRAECDWWWEGRSDPCPARPLGNRNGQFYFVTPQGELRAFNSRDLSRVSGLSELFCARVWWLVRHFPGRDRDGNPTKRPNTIIAAEAMMRVCFDKGIFSDEIELRLAGTWRGPDGRPVVHAGDVLIREGELLPAGTELGAPLYVIAGKRARPALEEIPKGEVGAGGTRYVPAPAATGNALVGVLLNWAYERDRSAELIAGYIAAATFGDATVWRPHVFLRARPGAGKSTLLRLIRAALGGASHEVLTSYSGPYITQQFGGQAGAILLDENESDSEQNRMRGVTELVRLLSDQGGVHGGRGSSGGQARNINIRGAVCMAATVKGQWKQADRSRITVIGLERFEREGDAGATPEEIEGLIGRVGQWSAGLRARMLSRWDLFQENMRRARKRIIELGGTVRDGNQLGHLIAGWWTLTSDIEADESMLDDIVYFTRWITTLADLDEGTDTATECWSHLLGARADSWRGGDNLTVGQVIARAREESRDDYRRALLGMGLRLLPIAGEPWSAADLAIANKHPGLENIFRGTDFANAKWAEILRDLEFLNDDGSRLKVTPVGPTRFGGPKPRGLLVPASVLPSLADEEP